MTPRTKAARKSQELQDMQSIGKRALLALSLLQAAWIGGCANPAVPGALPGAGFAPNLVQGGVVTPTQNPQVARYTILHPPRRATVKIDFGTDKTYGMETWAVPAPLDGSPVSILVAGMRAFTTYHMRARMNLPDGSQSFDSDHVFNTGGLPPERIPQVMVTRPDGLEPNPGIELVDIVPFGLPSTAKVQTTVFDLSGNLIWFGDLQDGVSQDSSFPIKPLPNGDFLMVVSGAFNGVREINLAGETVSQFSVGDVNQALSQVGFQIALASLHHDILPLPNGHLILLGNTFQSFTNLPGFPGTTQVLGDALIDLDQNRKPVWVWSAFDHLDINRQPLGFPDWTHSNAIIDSPDDGNLILSMRNQDWVIKINYRDGAGDGGVLWKLGPSGDFVIPGGSLADFNYAQHYPVLVGGKSTGVFPLLLFDNGNNRILDSNGTICGSPGAASCYSRPVLFELDETSKTAQILWQDKLPVFSGCCGSINTLGNGDVEFDIALESFTPLTSRVQEVTQEPVPRLVWQMDVIGQLAYRAFRMPSLYPRVYCCILPPRPPRPTRR